MLPPHDGRLHDVGMRAEDILYLGAVEILAAPKNDVLDPIDDRDESFRIDRRVIARPKPEIRVEGRCGGIRLLPIAIGHSTAADRQR